MRWFFYKLFAALQPSDLDDRVVASHSYKYAARLQQIQSRGNPILLHTTENGSHSGSAVLSERIRQLVNKWTFALQAVH